MSRKARPGSGSAATVQTRSGTTIGGASIDSVSVSLTINGLARTIRVEPRMTLLDALHEKLGLTGTKKACDRGECGACALHINGRRGLSCMTLASMLEGKKITTIEGLEKNGMPHPLQLAFVEHNGFQCGFLAERKRAEDNLRDSERRYHEAQMELEHANRVTTMGLLTASIAHEIKQPLTAAVTSADAGLRWLRRQSPNIEKARNAFHRIIRDGNRASEVIDRVRALVKKAPPQKDQLDTNQLIRDIVAFTSAEARKNGIALHTQLSAHLPLVWADRIQIQQTLLNLVINAIEAMSTSDEESRELRIITRHASSGVLVEVRDSGPGLDPEALDRIFDAFHTTKSGGMGIGLSICRSIIEAHGGRVWATQNSPRGAIFQFTLPAQSLSEA